MRSCWPITSGSAKNFPIGSQLTGRNCASDKASGALLLRNLWIYGVGGVIIPFAGIKAIDLVVTALHLA